MIAHDEPLPPIDELRSAARFYSYMNESFNQSFTSVDELMRLWRYCAAHPELPELPDTWPEAAIQCALAGEHMTPERFADLDRASAAARRAARECPAPPPPPSAEEMRAREAAGREAFLKALAEQPIHTLRYKEPK